MSRPAVAAPGEGPLQFGRPIPGRAHADRACAYGVVPDAQGRLALVEIDRPEGRYFDLPGGALDPGESEAAALTREFGEETGLIVRPVRLLARASQYMVKTDGAPVNNRSALFLAEPVGANAALKIEADHALRWIEPLQALTLLRHDSHAWAVAVWLRTRGP